MSRAEPTELPAGQAVEPWEPFPDIDLRHVHRLTDDTGLLQHAHHAVPDPAHGYCLDDNARALIAALLHPRARHRPSPLPLNTYLRFVLYAFDADAGRFRNPMTYNREWARQEEPGEESQGRAIWALGLTAALAPSRHHTRLMGEIFPRAVTVTAGLVHFRAQALAVLGLSSYLGAYPEATAIARQRDELAEALLTGYRKHAETEWPWWEDQLTYANARPCHALLVAGQHLDRRDMTDAGLEALRWLVHQEVGESGCLSVIGNRGWYLRDGERARFDQQPIEPFALVDASLAAEHITGDPAWKQTAWWAFQWFRGRNDVGISLYDPETGGCCDGLEPDGANQNQGAESTLAYLLSVLRLNQFRDHRPRLANGNGNSMRTIGYGLVGTSQFARFSLEQYTQLEAIKPRAVWSQTSARAEDLARQWNMTAYEGLDDLLNDPGVQLFHIATIPSQHAEQALQALKAGKHVLCEKPITIEPAEAQELIDAAGQRDRWLGVNLVMRYGPLTEPVARLIDTGALGRLLHGSLVNAAGDGGLPEDHWFWNEGQSGGILIEHGVHFFDLFRYWLGEAQVINAARNFRHQRSVVDQMSCQLRYGPETTVDFYHGFHQAAETELQQAELIFERGRLELTGWIFSGMRLRAVVDEHQLRQIETCFPGCHVDTLDACEAGATVRRGRAEPAGYRALISWEHHLDKQAIYGEALRRLLNDGLARIRDHTHQPRVSAEDGRAALDLAVEATRLAKKTD